MPLSASASAIANRRGIIAVTLAMASFIINDSLVKYVSASLPAGQLIFIRGVCCTLLLAGAGVVLQWLRPGALGEPGTWRHLGDKPVLWRSGLDAIGTLTYLLSLFHLPIANASAISMTTPLFITLAAAWWFRERVGAARWAAIAVGFLGVLLIVQPAAAGFNAWALLCLLGTLVNTARDLMTRRIASVVPSLWITLSACVTVTLLAGSITLTQGWQPVSPRQFALLATASVFLGMAYFLIVAGMRQGDLSVVAPFRYTALLFALASGWLVWGDVPNLLAWVGIALLVGAGLFMLRR